MLNSKPCPDGHKICRTCKHPLKLDNFGKDNRNRDGKKTACYDCIQKSATKRKQARKAAAADDPIIVKLPKFNPKQEPATWMVNTVADYISLVSKHPMNRTLHYAAGTVARLVGAARGYIQTAELEQKVEILEERLAVIEKAAKRGKGPVRPDQLRAQGSKLPDGHMDA